MKTKLVGYLYGFPPSVFESLLVVNSGRWRQRDAQQRIAELREDSKKIVVGFAHFNLGKT